MENLVVIPNFVQKVSLLPKHDALKNSLKIPKG